MECEPWKHGISRVGDVIADATSGRRNLRVYTESCLFLRAELDHEETASYELRISWKPALSSRKLADSTSYATLKRFTASKCLLKRALLRRSFVRAWHPWRIGSWKERFKVKGQAKRAALHRAENELAYKITIPMPFDVSLPTHRRPLYFPSFYENSFIYLTAIFERPWSAREGIRRSQINRVITTLRFFLGRSTLLLCVWISQCLSRNIL